MSFVGKIVSQKDDLIWRVDGPDEVGRPFWYYIMLNPVKLESFKRKIGNEELDLNDFGKILKSGYGTEPPPETKEQMHREFGLTIII